MYSLYFSYFFTNTSPTVIYTLSLHDALPISQLRAGAGQGVALERARRFALRPDRSERRVEAGRQRGDRRRHDLPDDGRSVDRKSTRLNSSHVSISYAVFCLKKKKKQYSYMNR